MRQRAKVTIDSLYEVLHGKSIGIDTNMINLYLSLEVVLRSCHSVTFAIEYLGIETVTDRGNWFQRTTNRKWYMGYQMVI